MTKATDATSRTRGTVSLVLAASPDTQYVSDGGVDIMQLVTLMKFDCAHLRIVLRGIFMP